MNKTEALYAATHLDLLKATGKLGNYWFEGLKLKIGKACFYTPDFVVQMPDGEIQLHEVKGHWEDDARVKVRAVADKFPFRIFAVQRKRGQWEVEEL